MNILTNIVAISATSLALAPNTTVTKVQHNSDFVLTESTQQIGVADCDSFSEYEQSQVEFLIVQIVSNENEKIYDQEINYTYNALYNNLKEKIGYVIDFDFVSGFGYVVMMIDDFSIIPIEVTIEQHSPYYGKSGMYLYNIKDGYNILTENGNIVRAVDYSIYSDKLQNTVKMNSSGKSKVPETLDYPYYYGEYGLSYSITDFYYMYSTNDSIAKNENNCANTAGVIALNYWNKYFNNKLLNLTQSDLETNYHKNMNNRLAGIYMDIFYDYMGTNLYFGAWGGTIPVDAYSGFVKLINEKGFDAEITRMISFEQIRLSIRCNVPVFITSDDYYFIDTYYLPDITNVPGNNIFSVESKHSSGYANAHTFIGYGYAEYKLYDQNNKLTSVQFIKVANGWGGYSYYNYTESNIMSAAGIQVFNRLSSC